MGRARGDVDNFWKTVENLLRTGGAGGGAKPRFQSIQGVVFRDTAYLGSRHGVSRGEARRVPDEGGGGRVARVPAYAGAGGGGFSFCPGGRLWYTGRIR